MDETRCEMAARLLHIPQMRELLLSQGRLPQQDLEMARHACEARTLSFLHTLQYFLWVHEARIDDETCSNPEMRMQERRAEAIVEGQHGHDSVGCREAQIFHNRFGVRND